MKLSFHYARLTRSNARCPLYIGAVPDHASGVRMLRIMDGHVTRAASRAWNANARVIVAGTAVV